jgi:glycosyltransferase involved in cell wall biosynthesis
MRIGVDTRFLANEGSPLFRNYTFNILQQLIQKHKEHDFFAFSERKDGEMVNGLENISDVLITPAAINLLSLKLWYDVKLPLALKKHKIDVLICPNGICCLTTKIPQILILQNLDFNPKTSFANAKSLLFYKKFTASFLKKADVVATVSQHLKDEMLTRYKKDNITVTGFGVPAFFSAIQWQQREAIKERHAEGFEYFIFTATLHPAANLLNVLKAFSIFKKWQKSGMKLMIIVSENKYLRGEIEKLSTYKYRNDVLVKENLSWQEIPNIIAASYAAIYTPLSDAFPTPLIEAMQCHVPLIASLGAGTIEVAAESALYINPEKQEEIAEAMKTLFKDENLRSKLIEKGKQQAGIFNLDKVTGVISQLIEQAVSK